jgi:glycosyltransferase involved in cell wall biosynthesis
MEDKIIFPGLQTDVLPWMSAMDIFMMTSSFEGLPIALLEAMSMECAIVTTDAGGIKELVRDGNDGFMKPVNEWMDLQQPLGLLISQPELLKEFGQKSRNRVIESFSITAMVDQIEKIYLDVIQQKK